MTRRGSPSRRRRGGVYVLVLAAAMLVTVLGLSAILAARVSTRTSQSTGDLTEARFNAQAAIELARFWIKSDPNWRSRPQGAWASDRPIGEGGGRFSVEVIDPVDGTLSDSDAEAVYVIGTGRTHSVRELCEIAFGEVDLDYREFVKVDERYYRPAEVDLLIGDSSKARRVLSWEPTYTFRELIKEMVQSDLAALTQRQNAQPLRNYSV